MSKYTIGKSVPVDFRGEKRNAVIDTDCDDSAVNYRVVEWHFEGLDADGHDALNITDDEEFAITSQLMTWCDENQMSPEDTARLNKWFDNPDLD